MGRKSQKHDPLPDSFLELPDVPDSYAGQAGKAATVKDTEDGLEFKEAGGGGVDVRSGVITNVQCGDFGIQRFTYEPEDGFVNTPYVTLTLHGMSRAVDILILTDVGKVGFGWKIFKGHGGATHTWDIHWIATDAGNLYP